MSSRRAQGVVLPAVIALTAPAAALALGAGEAVAVPSGQAISFHEALLDADIGEGLYRVRFVAPEIGGDAPRSFDEVMDDLAFLCTDVALPALAGADVAPRRIVISLMAEPVAVGEASPDVRQYFEAYSVADGTCIWEPF